MPFRFLRITATGSFDTTTVLVNDYLPENNAKQPLLTVTQALVGRINFSEQLRPGSVGALVRVRSWGIATLSMSQRSPSAAEVAAQPSPDDPTPEGTDVVLQTLTVTSEWSEVLMLGSSDALTFQGNHGTIEIAIVDADEQIMMGFWNAQTAQAIIEPTFNVVEITAAGAVPAWSGLTYFLVNIAAGGTLTLPAMALVDEPSQAYFIRTGGGLVVMAANGVEPINEQASGIFELPGIGGAYLARVGDGWVTPALLLQATATLSNAVDGAVVDLPILNAVTVAVQLNFTAYGDARLPALLGAPHGCRYLLYRASGTAQVRLKPTVGDNLNGTASDVAYLGVKGALLVEGAYDPLLGTGTWTVVSAGGSIQAPVQTVASGNVVLVPWGTDELLLLLADAGAAQTATLPSAALMPPGARLRVLTRGGATISAAAAETIVGKATAPALTFAVAANTAVLLVSDGTSQWNVL